MTGWGSIGLRRSSIGAARVVGESDYLGAARQIRQMVDILGPIASLCRSMGAWAPSSIVRPYNRIRANVIVSSAALLAESRSFIDAQIPDPPELGMPYENPWPTPEEVEERARLLAAVMQRREDAWVELGQKMEPDLIPALILPRLRVEWSGSGAPVDWSEITEAPVSWEVWRDPQDLADDIVGGYSGTLPSIASGYHYIYSARYGIGAVPVSKAWWATVGWILLGAWTVADSLGLLDSAQETAQSFPPDPIITSAIDGVIQLRERFERLFMPAVYQPVRAATKIMNRAGGDNAYVVEQMLATNPRTTEPGMPGSWDGTFGFGAGNTTNDSDSVGWFPLLLTGGLVTLAAVLVMGDT